MNLLRSIAMTFSMFSRIPMPRVEWEKRNMGYVLAALPLVGVAVGLSLWGWIAFCNVLDLGRWVYAAGLALLPVAVSGGIHLDGFTDTVDALASHAPVQRKNEILWDPHVGTFAVLALCSYLLLYFALCTELQPVWSTALGLGLIHCLSRCLGGLAALCLASDNPDKLMEALKSAAERRAITVLLLECAVICAGMIVIHVAAGIAVIIAGCTCYLYTSVIARKQFGSMSGDLAGHLIQMCELAGIAAVLLVQKGMALWFS